jgi:hypothetical protein
VSIRKVGFAWPLVLDILSGGFLVSLGVLCLVAVKKKWDWLIYHGYIYFERWAGREMMEVVTFLIGIVSLLSGGYLLLRTGMRFF